MKFAVVGALAVAVPSAGGAPAEVAATPAATLFADGTIYAVANAPGRTYVGGDFTLLGRSTGSWVAIAPSGDVVPGRPRVAGVVDAAVADGRGGWFLAGAIGAAEPTARVVHVRKNGTLDPGWRVAVHGGVAALARRGGVLFLGGDFDRVDGRERRALAAVGTAKGALLKWRARGAVRLGPAGKKGRPGTVSTLALSPDGRTLYVAGSFDRIGSTKRSFLAAVSTASGRVTRWNPAPNADVAAIAPRNGVVYVGGSFGRIGGAARNAIAALDARRGRSLAFDAHASDSDSIQEVVPTRTAVYVAGDFSALGGKSRHLVAAVNPRTGAVSDWEPQVSGEVTALAVDSRSTTVYVGGDLSDVGGQRRDGLASLDARTGAVTAWDPRALGDIAVIAPAAGGTVFVGGDLGFVGGVRRPGLASFGDDGTIDDWTPALDGIVRSLALSADGSRLYVGGAFAPGDAPSQRNLAVVDVASGALHAFGGGTSSGVWAIAPSADGSTVYIGGAFVTVAGKRRVRLAALDAVTGGLLAWNSGANDLVRVLLPAGDVVFAGGDFRSAGGLPRARLVQLDAATGAALGWDPDPDDNVWALALHDRTLYVGGAFGQIGNRTRNGLAAVDVESGDASSWDPSADDTVRSLALSADGQRLFAAGAFEKMGRATRGYAEFSTRDGTLTGWNPAPAFDGYSIGIGRGESAVVIGGDGGVDLFR